EAQDRAAAEQNGTGAEPIHHHAPALAMPMEIKLNVIANAMSVRDHPVAADIGCRNTGSEKIEPIATQPTGSDDDPTITDVHPFSPPVRRAARYAANRSTQLDQPM